ERRSCPRMFQAQIFVQFFSKPGNQLFGVIDKLFGFHGGSDARWIIHQVSLARAALIPMYNGKVVLQSVRSEPCHRRCRKSWPAMNDKQYWISPILTAHTHELFNSPDADSFITLHTRRRNDAAQLPYDLDRCLPRRWFNRFGSSGLTEEHCKNADC